MNTKLTTLKIEAEARDKKNYFFPW